ncbi:hypothetical protein ACFRR6_24485 [Streptomyces sp. NPDC056891]|uniref:hypothetical protein n=1 Tax=Streptomyces sp. NPDC056891 TaxID=3345961 RepID=UPI00369DB52D
MTQSLPDPAAQTKAAVVAAYPGLRQSHPRSFTGDQPTVLLDGLTARYSWGPYEVHVTVGHEAHLNTNDSEDLSLQRQVRAHATLLVTNLTAISTNGHVEWDVANPRPELIFPAAFTAAAADRDDPRFTSAVLATVMKALDYARHATEDAGHRAREADQEAQWVRERPANIRLSTWLRQKRAERDAQVPVPEDQ